MAAIRTFCIFFFTILISCSTIVTGKAQTGTKEQDCKADLMATGQYVLILKEQRDRYEEEIARLRYHVSELKKENLVLQQTVGKGSDK